MKRLFVSLYVAALATFVVALAFTWVVLVELSADRDTALALASVRGGLLTVADSVREAEPERRQNIVETHAPRYGFPLRLQATTKLAPHYDEYGMAAVESGEQFTAYARVDDSTAIAYGPIDVFAAAAAWEFVVALSLPIVLLLALVFVALRPLVRQTRAMASAAEALSLGQWDTRIDAASAPVTPVLASAFNVMAQQVQDSLGAQQHLLESASHELRTPLSKVRFAVELLATADTAPLREQWLARAQSGCDRLDEIVDELLDHVRVAGLDEPTEVAVVDVVALVEAVTDQIDEEGIAVEVHVGWTGRLPTPAAAVPIGPRSLKRVIRNLVDNAQYWGRRCVSVQLSLSDDQLTMAVEDDGPGIAVADRKRVLEPFETDRSADGGLGLGLALVARIALQTDATVALDQSERLGGCRAQLTWTVHASDGERPSFTRHRATAVATRR